MVQIGARLGSPLSLVLSHDRTAVDTGLEPANPARCPPSQYPRFYRCAELRRSSLWLRLSFAQTSVFYLPKFTLGVEK